MKMFCSNNFTLEYKPTYVRLIISPCVVELFNLICFSSFVYILVLLLIYVRWSPNKYLGVTLKKRSFHGHNIRYCLVLLLLLIQLIDLGEYTIGHIDIWYIKLVPASAIVSNIICQIFYNKLEECNNLYYLIVTIIYWLSCGFCKVLMFITVLNLNLNFKYVAFSSSLGSTMLCYCLAINDFVSLLKEMKRKLSKITEVNDEMNERIICAYRHPFCSWYSKITFYWLTSVLRVGYVSTFEVSHFGQLPEIEKSSAQFEKLEKIFHREKTKIVKNKGRVNLWKCFAKGYWRTFVLGGILKLIGDIAGFIPPLGISVVVRYIEMIQNPDTKKAHDEFHYIKWNEFLNNGYIMAVIVFVAILVQGTLSQNSTHIINVEGIRLKNALQALIYQKLLKIRKNNMLAEDNNCDNIGYITNLTTEDTYNIMSCFWIGHYIWAIPLKIVLLIYLLYEEIGTSAVIGSVICIAVMLFLQLVIGKRMSKNYKLIAAWSDRRLRRINEILQGIRFIKLSCWENNFTEEISNLRKNELKYLNIDSIHWTNITFLANTSSIIIAVTTLVIYQMMEKSPIALSSLFTSLALFNQLTVPLFIFPVMVPIIISAVVSVKRIENFLSLSEIKSEEKNINEVQNKNMDEVFKKCNSVDDYNTRLRKITENSENEEENKIKHDDIFTDDKLALRINRAVCFWGDPSKSVLEIDELSIYAGSLNVIIGGKGSGKTSLLCALLDEMVQYSGKIKWKKHLKFGYVPQSPWLLNDTVTENITFGFPYQEKHFARVVQLCALNVDINSLPNKQYTVIGGRGVALSGGQKQRVMIARMLYSKPDIVLLDDPFSSLDTKMGNYIFENCIKKYLIKQSKTVIMTTSQKKFLPYADQIIVMENCKLKISGTLAEVAKTASEEIQGLDEQNTKKLLTPCLSFTEEESKYQRSSKGSVFIPLKRRRSTLSGSRYFTHDLPLPIDDCEVSNVNLLQKRRRSRAATVTEYPNSPTLHRTVFRVSSLQTNHTQQCAKKNKKRDLDDVINSTRHQSTVSDFSVDFEDYSDQFLESSNELHSVWDMVDNTEKSNNSFKNYRIYIQSCGVFTVIFYFLLTFGWQIMRILADFWLSHVVSNLNKKQDMEQEMQWHLYLYVGLSLVALTMSLFSTAIGQYAGSIARVFLHQKMLNNVLKCSVQFFDNTSFGQIIDRFSTDVEIIDKKISTSTQRLIQFQLLCLSAILVNCFVTPWFIILIIPITLIYYMVQRFYRCSYRELQHLENFLRTPVINHFSETFNGLEVIRALNQQQNFLNSLFQRIDKHTNVFLILNSSNRWLGIILDYLGGVIVFAAMLVSLISVTIKPTLKTSSFFGLAINYTLLIPIYLTWVVKFLVDLEIYMGAVERIHRYTKIPMENYLHDAPKPSNWPQKGIIQFKNVSLRYISQGQCVIQNLNLLINSGQKVGICGRTGSGKSSLMMSLFKMVPLIEGEIFLDGVNIGNIPLQHLRSKVSIVPQDIILFNGTIRQNLDLKCKFSDDELWRCLKLVKIHDTITSIGGLNAHVHDGGSNLSVGEKQLICLARAILRESCCLILDEATNALQPEIETEFLNMIFKLFQNRTVVVITHRISSLLYFDRVLVLDDGILVEDGSPKELMNNTSSKFFKMMKMS